MADIRTTSTLDIKVQARELGGLERQLKSTFNAGSAREFNGAMQQTVRLIGENAQQVGKLSERLKALDEGTEAFRAMNKELAEAKRRGQELEGALMGVARAGRAAGAAGGGGGAGGAGGAGRGVGGFQLAMPGMGAIQGALGAIPVAGAIAAGSLMAAAQTYGSYLKYEQAQLSAAPYLMRPLQGMTYERRMLAAGTQGRMVGPDGQALAPGQEAAARAQGSQAIAPMVAAEMAGRFSLPGVLAGGVDAIAGTDMQQTVKDVAQSFYEDTAVGRVMARGVAAYGATAATALGHGDAVARAQAAGAGLRWDPGRAAQYTAKPFDPTGYMQAGIGMGFAPQESIEMAGQMSRAGRGPVSTDEFEQALAIQRITGMGVEQTGALQLAMNRAGGLAAGTGDMQQVADAVGAAVALGLESSEVQAELQKQTQFMEDQASRGIVMNPRSLDKMALTLFQATGGEAFGGAGAIRGVRAGEIVRSFAAGGAEVGFKGPERPTDLRLMRAMGYTGKGGVGEYAKYRLMMQDPSKVADAMPDYLKQFEMPGMNEDVQTLLIQQALGQFGARVGPEEARSMIGMAGKPRAEGVHTPLDMLTGAGKAITGALGAATRGEAGIEMERIGVGGQIAGDMQRLSRVTNDMAGTFMNTLGPALDAVTKATENFTSALNAGSAAMSAR